MKNHKLLFVSIAGACIAACLQLSAAIAGVNGGTEAAPPDKEGDITVFGSKAASAAAMPVKEDFETDSYLDWKLVYSPEYEQDPDSKETVTGRAKNETGESNFGQNLWQFRSRPESTEEGKYTQYLISPELTTNESGNKIVSLYATELNMSDQQYAVGYSTTGDNPEDFTFMETQHINVFMFLLKWIPYSCTIPGDAKYIAIKYFEYRYDKNIPLFLYIDDINIYEASGPEAEISANDWNVGLTYVDKEKTSDVFVLKNKGAGTLTVKSVTELAAPWSTTFNKDEVALAPGEEYEFTFSFNSEEEGSFSQRFDIETEQGTVSVTLNGTAEIYKATLPLTQDFEDETWQFWTTIKGDPENPNKQGLFSTVDNFYGFGRNGTDCWEFKSWEDISSGNYDMYLITPELPETGKNLILTFYYQYVYEEYPTKLQIGYSKTTSNIREDGAFTWIEPLTLERDTKWIPYQVEIPAGTRYIAFNCCPDVSAFDLRIDDIEIKMKEETAAALPLKEDFETDSYLDWKLVYSPEYEQDPDSYEKTTRRTENVTYIEDFGDHIWEFMSRSGSDEEGKYSQYLISPELAANENSSKVVSMHATEYNLSDQQYAVGYSTTGNDPEDFTFMETQHVNGSGFDIKWIPYTCLVPGNAKYIAIKYSDYKPYMFAPSFLFIDNIEITEVTEPVASLSVAEWKAPLTAVDKEKESDVFILKNMGAGTLTVKNITQLESPWSTTFNKDEVALAPGEKYEFTFSFNPTEEGNFSQSFDIETEQGTVSVALTGKAQSGKVTLPLTQDFEDDTWMLWSTAVGDPENTTNGLGLFSIVDNFYGIGRNGTDCWTFDSWADVSSGDYSQYLITPELTETKEDLVLSLYYFYAFYGATTKLQIGYSTTTDNVLEDGTFTWFEPLIIERNEEESWLPFSIEIPAGAKYIALKCCPDQSAFDLRIDDIEIKTKEPGTGISSTTALTGVRISNPAKGTLCVSTPESSEVRIYDTYGHTVKTAGTQAGGTATASLPAGMYLIKVKSGGKQTTYKTVVK